MKQFTAHIRFTEMPGDILKADGPLPIEALNLTQAYNAVRTYFRCKYPRGATAVGSNLRHKRKVLT